MSINSNWRMQIHSIWILQALLIAALSMSTPFWPLLVKQMAATHATNVHFWSAAIYMAPQITCAISAPIWGRMGDRHGYKLMVVRAALALFVTQVLLAYAHSPGEILAYRLLGGMFAGFLAAAQAWGVNMSPVGHRTYVLGRLQAATAVGTLLGPLMGGVIATYLDYHHLFLFSAWTVGAVAVYFPGIVIAAAQPTARVVVIPADYQTLASADHLTGIVIVDQMIGLVAAAPTIGMAVDSAQMTAPAVGFVVAAADCACFDWIAFLAADFFSTSV